MLLRLSQKVLLTCASACDDFTKLWGERRNERFITHATVSATRDALTPFRGTPKAEPGSVAAAAERTIDAAYGDEQCVVTISRPSVDGTRTVDVILVGPNNLRESAVMNYNAHEDEFIDQVHRYEYDENDGWTLFTSEDPQGELLQWFRFTRDAQGRVTRREQGEGQLDSPPSQVYVFEYEDKPEWTTQKVDNNGDGTFDRTIARTHTYVDDLLISSVSGAEKIAYAYDDSERLVEEAYHCRSGWCANMSRTTHHTYDEMNRRTRSETTTTYKGEFNTAVSRTFSGKLLTRADLRETNGPERLVYRHDISYQGACPKEFVTGHE